MRPPEQPEPRTSHGPRFPDSVCAGTAEELFGMSEEDVEKQANEISEPTEE